MTSEDGRSDGLTPAPDDGALIGVDAVFGENDDPRARAAALGADYDKLRLAAGRLQGVLAVVSVLALGLGLAACLTIGAHVLLAVTALLATLVGHLLTVVVLLGARARPGNEVLAAALAGIAAVVPLSVMLTVLVITGFDPAAVIGVLVGSVFVVNGQWAGPSAALKELRRTPPRPSLGEFARLPRWVWAPDGRLGTLIAVGLAGIAISFVEAVALIVATPLVVVLYLTSMLGAAASASAVRSPRRLLTIMAGSLVATALIATAGYLVRGFGLE